MTLLGRFLAERRADALVEYALIAGFIILIVVVAVAVVGTATNAHMNNVATQFS